MGALAGGSADKAGNHFEAEWTVLRIVRLLQAGTGDITLEPMTGGEGAEYVYRQDGQEWCEQVKSSPGTITVSSLITSGLLQNIYLQVTRGRKFRLITAGAAPDLVTLSERARATDGLDDFCASLNRKQAAQFATIEEMIVDQLFEDEKQSSMREAKRLLEQLHVSVTDLDSVRAQADDAIAAVFRSPVDKVRSELKEFINTNQSVNRSAVGIDNYLYVRGVRRQALAHDRDVLGAVRESRARRARRLNPAPDRFLVPRGDAKVLAELIRENSTPLFVLDAPGGYGKSTVALEASEILAEEEWHVAVISMDETGGEATTVGLGKSYGLSDSPVSVLNRMSDTRRALLVIDQLDAISSFSGRQPRNGDLVTDLIHEATQVPNVKVLIVSRTIDLTNDSRFSYLLKEGEDRVTRYQLAGLASDAVDKCLSDAGVPIPSTGVQILLGSPLNFKLYVDVYPSLESTEHLSVEVLYSEYLRRLEDVAAQHYVHLDIIPLLYTLVDVVTEHEALTVSRASVEGAGLSRELSWLISQGVVTGTGERHDKVGFFHESFLDYLVARRFMAGRQSLVAYLQTTDQGLFLRSFLRQILRYLRGEDLQRYEEECRELLLSSLVRAHLKDALLVTMQEKEPSQEFFIEIEGLEFSEGWLGHRRMQLLRSPQWFVVAHELGRWQDWLEELGFDQQLMYDLRDAAEAFPAEVSGLLVPFVATGEGWEPPFQSLFSPVPAPGMTELVCIAVREGLFRSSPENFWYMAKQMIRLERQGLLDILESLIAWELSLDAPAAASPLTSGVESEVRLVSMSLAEQAPERWVRTISPWVMALEPEKSTQPGIRYQEARRMYSQSFEVFSGLIGGFIHALDSGPGDLRNEVLDQLGKSECHEHQNIACVLHSKGGDSDGAIQWLLEDRRRFVLGERENPLWASQQLLQTHSLACSNELFSALQEILLGYWEPRWKGWFGRYQFELLAYLPKDRLSSQARMRLQELLRKDWVPRGEPLGVIIGTPSSPIPAESARHMSDDNWLSALGKDRPNWGTGEADWLVGGKDELIELMGEIAKNDPQRFARLALRFDDSLPGRAGGALIEAVFQSDQSSRDKAISHLFGLFPEETELEIAWQLSKTSAWSPQLSEILKGLIESPRPRPGDTFTFWTEDAQRRLGDLSNAALNCTRGAAGRALAHHIIQKNIRGEEAIDFVMLLIADPVLPVVQAGYHALYALVAIDPSYREVAADLIERMPTECAESTDCRRLFLHFAMERPAQYENQLKALVERNTVVGGKAWARLFIRGEHLTLGLPSDLLNLPANSRAGAASVFGANQKTSLREIRILLDDKELKVRDAMVSSLRRNLDLRRRNTDQLLTVIAQSQAYVNFVPFLVDELEDFRGRLSRTMLVFLRTGTKNLLVDNAAGTDHFHARYVLVPLLFKFYGSSSHSLRQELLDLIDLTVQFRDYHAHRLLIELDEGGKEKGVNLL